MDQVEWIGGKSAGCISDRGNGFSASIERGGKRICDRFFANSRSASQEEARANATAWLKNKSDALGLTKNKYRLHETHGELMLSHERIMKFSLQDLDLVCKHVWSVSGTGYVTTTIEGKTVRFHKLIAPSEWDIVKHQNKDRLDNRRENLKETSAKIKSNSRKRLRSNTSGITSVYFVDDDPQGKWVCRWREDGRFRHRSFAVKKHGDAEAKDLATKARDAAWERLGIESEK
jgi:hypothetical protein